MPPGVDDAEHLRVVLEKIDDFRVGKRLAEMLCGDAAEFLIEG